MKFEFERSNQTRIARRCLDERASSHPANGRHSPQYPWLRASEEDSGFQSAIRSERSEQSDTGSRAAVWTNERAATPPTADTPRSTPGCERVRKTAASKARSAASGASNQTPIARPLSGRTSEQPDSARATRRGGFGS